MVQIYQRKWTRGNLKSFIGYIRDCIVLAIPVKKLPSWCVKLLYGATFKFAFFVHPRAYQDVFISVPAFSFLKLFLRRQTGYKFFSATSPFVLNKVITAQNTNGLVIAQLTVPERIFGNRKETVTMLQKSLLLASKICKDGAVVGLGGWYPMITKRGAAISDYAKGLNLMLTNGHCGTLASIYMMVEKIASISNMSLSDITLGVIGVGKMGANVARAFLGKVQKLVLIDVNPLQLDKLNKEFQNCDKKTKVEFVILKATNKNGIRKILGQCHVAVCSTSNYRNILKLRDLPRHFIAIDDSRPEALPRDPTKERLVLEGGLLKIVNARIDYNFGFGEDDNVFGCLGEAFLLALDKQCVLKPTIGDVDLKNLHRMINFCKENGVTQGDFKTSHINVTEDDLKSALELQKQKDEKE